jgi:hypothetical protein
MWIGAKQPALIGTSGKMCFRRARDPSGHPGVEDVIQLTAPKMVEKFGSIESWRAPVDIDRGFRRDDEARAIFSCGGALFGHRLTPP